MRKMINALKIHNKKRHVIRYIGNMNRGKIDNQIEKWK